MMMYKHYFGTRGWTIHHKNAIKKAPKRHGKCGMPFVMTCRGPFDVTILQKLVKQNVLNAERLMCHVTHPNKMTIQ